MRAENLGEEVERRMMEELMKLNHLPDNLFSRADITVGVISVLDQMEAEKKITPEQNVQLLSNSIRYLNRQLDGTLE